MDWDRASEAAAAAKLKNAAYYEDLRRIERERGAAGGYTPWCSDGSIPMSRLEELARDWIWVRAGVRSNPAHQALAQQLRERGYDDAPPGLRFDGDPPGVGLYLAAPREAHEAHLQDQRRRHEARLRELIGRPREAMRQMGADVSGGGTPTAATVEQIQGMALPTAPRRR